MRYKYLWLVTSMIMAIVVVVLTVSRASGFGASRLLALPFVLILPGYVITGALFPRGALGSIERLAVSLGLSLSVTVLGGVALNWTPWGLQPESWAVLLGGITIIAGGVALVQYRRFYNGVAFRPRLPLRAREGVLLALAAALALGALGIARVGASTQQTPGFTQLWILPPAAPDGNAIRLGIRSMEANAEGYSLQLKAGNKILQEWPLIDLAPGMTWEDSVELGGQQSRGRLIEAFLYRLDTPGVVYRHVLLQSGQPAE